jgi:predicted RNA-binding protein with PUA-like domain
VATKHWLLKSEPGVFSIDDLSIAKNQTTFWDGVRNYQARNFLRNEMKLGDKIIFYHSNTEPPCAVGTCEIVKEGYPDFTAFDPENDHFDPKSKKEFPTWFMVNIKLVKKFSKIVSIAEIKANKNLQKMQLVKRGNRLSVISLTKKEFEEIEKLGQLK